MDLRTVEKGSKDRAQAAQCCFNPFTFSSWLEPTDAYPEGETRKADRAAVLHQRTANQPA